MPQIILKPFFCYSGKVVVSHGAESHPLARGGSQGFEMERKYSVPSNPDSRAFSREASEDLHTWSIYRQNLNSDFTDSALGSTDKSPLPYGNFQLRDTTVQSILSHPRYGPKSALGSNMYTYLKFGLPRVFPPNHNGSNRSGTPQNFTRNASARPHTVRGPKPGSRGPRDGSSGYDSSDNETSNQYKHNRKYRSDPDFRMQNVHPSYQGVGQFVLFALYSDSVLVGYLMGSPGLPLAAMQQGGIRPSTQWNRNKSISEANLLAAEYNRSHHNMDPIITIYGIPGVIVPMNHIHRPRSKTESHLSVAPSRRGPPSVIRADYLSQEEEIGTSFMYPHLQVCGIGVWPRSSSCFKSKQHLLLNEISFEIRGGEVMAIMSTSEQEGTALLDVVAGLSAPLIGNILLNGQNVRHNHLRSRVAYVQSDNHLCKDMTVIQTLRFHYDLKKPTDKLGYLKINAMDRINVLIEDLGLEQVRNTRVSSMTVSERRRLNVACHLLLDTDIVVLDQPTKGMDIFDTFFLVEYLKQWANGGAGNALGRIVILTMHPPTYEIFTMLSRILLISAGRTMFSGKGGICKKQEPMSDPGPPSALPMTVRNTNCFMQGFVLFTKAMFYTQPNTFLNWLTLIIISASLSLIIGGIFWDVPSSDPQLILNDRQGYHYSVMCIMLWPLLLFLTVSEIRRNRKTVERDVNDGLYGRLTYIITKTLINLFPSLFVWLIYVVPSYSMCGLYMQSLSNYDGFYIYIGSCNVNLFKLYTNIHHGIYLFAATRKHSDFDFIGVYIRIFLVAGFVLHLKDLPFYCKWLQYVSPTSWLMPFLLNRELSPEALQSSSATTLCRNMQVQHQDIIVQLPCPNQPKPNGTNVLLSYGYDV
ncbi:hypothetical protein NQ317_013783 [Molorchus minor]|uniref:ABC transporter domain-containing protein n=1 Tax=Molorchus minor TaxID=1323400 RepID=A0ABQ9IVV2_9CUCU|nr:hypothetical protein NQ317_013783 [Molorchus minor]